MVAYFFGHPVVRERNEIKFRPYIEVAATRQVSQAVPLHYSHAVYIDTPKIRRNLADYADITHLW